MSERKECITQHYLPSNLDLGVFLNAEGLTDIQLVAHYIQSALGWGKGWANEVQEQVEPQAAQALTLMLAS